MKKTLIAFLYILTCAATCVAATVVPTGYYRVHNYMTDRYIYIYDNRGSLNYATTTADLAAIELWNNLSRAVSDPATVLYISNQGGSLHNIEAQGTGIYQIIESNVTLFYNSKRDAYLAYGSSGGMVRYLGDARSSMSYDSGVLSCTLSEDKGEYRYWKLTKIDENSSNYFGVKPQFQIGGKWYAPFYAAFPFSLKSPGMKVYIIVRAANGMAVLRELPTDAVVPASTPVYIECSSQHPTDNRLTIGGTPNADVSGNLLKGVYFNNPRNDKHKNQTAFDSKTMRVLGTTSTGKLGFIVDNSLRYLNANSSYLALPASESFPMEMPVVTEDEFEELNKPEPPVVPVSQITLTGVDGTPETTQYVGATCRLKAIVAPDNATDRSVAWSSDNEAVATVSADGNVSFRAAGKVTITVASVSTPAVSASVAFTVIPVKSFTFDITPSAGTLQAIDAITIRSVGNIEFGAQDYNAAVTFAKDGTVIASYDATALAQYDLYDYRAEEPVFGYSITGLSISAPGTYVLTIPTGMFNYDNGLEFVDVPGVTVTWVISPSGGISSVEAEAEPGDAVIYNMQGIRVEKPLVPGMYIVNGRKQIIH